MDALVSRHLDAVEEANDGQRDARRSGKFRKLCRPDPDATMATSSKAPLRSAYKWHTAVDDLEGIVVDVEIGTGEEHDTCRYAERPGKAGKPHEVVITAVATTLVTLANALCRKRQKWASPAV